MYLPPHFETTDVEALHRLIGQHPLGALVVNGPHGLDANHLPFLLDAPAGTQGRLLAHVARANPLWREVADGDEVLVIFRAAHAYISPNWYPSQQASHKLVPTWNYQVVHVHGRLRVHDDERFVRGVVARLTRLHEARAQEPRPWTLGDAPKDHIDAMLAAVVGLEVEIDRLVGKSKLSQNREAQDRRHAAQVLDQRGEQALAQAMRDAGG